MQRFSSSELQRNTAEIQRIAELEPVAISYRGRDRLVLMSTREFARLKERDKMVIAIEDTPEEFIAEMQNPYYSAEQAALDYLLDE